MVEQVGDVGSCPEPRILLVTDRVPGRTAGNEFRVANVVEGLLQVGSLHVCLVDSSEHGASLEPDHRYTASVVRGRELPRGLRLLEGLWTIPNMRYRNGAALRRAISQAAAGKEFDLVWFSRARMHWLCADLLGGAHIVDLDDLNDRLLASLISDRDGQLGRLRALPKSAINLLVARRWSRWYRRLDTMVDRLVVCHDGDRGHLGSAVASVVPNGYPPPDETEPGDAEGSTMLFVGPLTYEPNLLAVRWFVENVLERVRSSVPDATLTVVGALGRTSIAHGHDAVELCGWVPDVAPYYERAAIAVAPLHSGGGTRLKVLEAMALRRPLVATTFAIEGIDLEPGGELLIGDDPSAFAEACVRLLTDDDLADAQVERAFRTFSDRYVADRSRDAVAEIARSVLDDRRASGGFGR